MLKRNCWEVKRCGREPGGEKEKELGICPASVNIYADNINEGRNGGRSCWALIGTMCGGQIQGTFAAKYGDCTKCDFFQLVKDEEGTNYKSVEDIKNIIKSRMTGK